ncbi:2-C-methyl-D-erythritol 4-phosphate cytidylyltransferase [bacterium]|nr:2-C-methyl-D-erythritol 4-phosphate cytidylyltransferase [bacterium]
MDLPLIAIIPSAGIACRMGFDKLTTPLCGKSVLSRTLETFQTLGFEKIIVPVTPGRVEEFQRLLDPKITVIVGGNCRAKSVHNAVETLSDLENAIVVIHDCDRPFVKTDIILKTIEEAKTAVAAIAAVPCASTVKEANQDGTIASTIPREKLYFASTPQTFQLKTLREAYAKLDASTIWETLTDEAMILEKANLPVRICRDSEENFKLTTRKDWDFAAYLLTKNA